MNKKNFVFATILTASVALAITACGDDVTEVTEVHKDGMAILKAGEKLSKQACDTTNVGEMLFVTDSSAAFVCNGESWLTLEGDKGENGTQGETGEKGEKGDTGKAGAKGEQGDKGDQGETGEKGAKGDEGAAGDQGPVGATGAAGAAGANCSVADTTDAETNLKGFKLICADTLVGVVWNGEKGAAGNAGTRGADCVAEDDGNGKVTVTCGEASSSILYKAVCGMNPYDPAKSFCTEGEVYDLCGGKAYDPKKSFCSEGELFSCGGKPYDPEKQYCKLATTVENYGWLEDARDEQNIQVYKTVKICNDETSCQTWMAENLNYSVNPGEQSWCGGGRGETEGDCSVYGRLYTWNAAIIACPEGWRLPSENEWTSLLTYSSTEVTYDVSISKNTYVGAGMALKSNSGWNEDGNGDDAYGFSVLPAGYRGPLVLFAGVRDNATFWTDDQTFSTYDAYYVLFKKDADDVSTSTISSESMSYGYSVRCIQDN